MGSNSLYERNLEFSDKIFALFRLKNANFTQICGGGIFKSFQTRLETNKGFILNYDFERCSNKINRKLVHSNDQR